jgi:hypothetical protein
MDREKQSESRWAAELRAFLAALGVLALLCVALIAQTLWGNGAMLAILLGGIAVGFVIKYAFPGHHDGARTH